MCFMPDRAGYALQRPCWGVYRPIWAHMVGYCPDGERPKKKPLNERRLISRGGLVARRGGLVARRRPLTA